MTLRLDSTDIEATSGIWSPNGDVILQIDKPDDAVLKIYARLDEAAPFRVIDVIRDGRSFVRLVPLSSIQLKIFKNSKGGQVRVWSND